MSSAACRSRFSLLRAAWGILVLCSLSPAGVEAEESQWRLCPPQDFLEPSTTATSADQSTRIIADDVAGRYEDSIRFQGNVVLEQAGRQIEANDVTVTSDRNIEARGGIRASDGQLEIRAGQAVLNEREQQSRFTDVNYFYKPRHVSGRADEFISEGNIATLTNSTYSTCPETQNGWQLEANNIVLNRDTGLGKARSAVFRFKDIPLLYFPTLTFPIDNQRRSGFLFPELGRGDLTGAELLVPYYWNIAPQFDATISPRFMSKRGVMLENQFRYLSSDHEGQIQANYLGQDRETDTNRYLYALNHEGQFGRKWILDMNGSYVSDDDYLNDFSSGLSLGSISHLQRQAKITYGERWYSFSMQSLAYQTIDPNIIESEKPYRILPQIRFRTALPNNLSGLSVSLDSELSRFTHSINTEGERLNLVPRVSWRKNMPGWFMQPAFSWHHTGYTLDDEEFSRALPVLSFDSGLFFDRVSPTGSIQTLEPRLFYLYAADRNQSDIPLFDTSEPVFGFSSLFRENRFSGIDRIGDANQLTLALTSRYLDSVDHHERWRASIGQILYFDDLDVALEGTTVVTDSRSSFASELFYSLGTKWQARSVIVASEDLKETERFNLTLGYRGKDNRLFNIEHIYRRDDLQQSGISFGWPLNERWRLLGRWLYSHDEHRDIDILGGIEYESCCYRARLVGTRFVTDEQGEYNNNISFQIVFKGLASLGQGSELLEQRITGYDNYDE